MSQRFVRFGKVIAIVIELMRSFWESYVVSIEVVVVVVVGVQSSLVWFGWWFGVGVGECLLCLLAVRDGYQPCDSVLQVQSVF